MKTWKKWAIPFILAFAFALPISAIASEIDDDRDVFMAHDKHGFHRGGWAHHEMYINLLVEKYAPEMTAEWAPVLAEKKRLMEEMRAFYEADPERAKKQLKAYKKKKDDEREALKNKLRESYQRFEEAVQSKDAAKIKEALSEQLTNLKEANARLANKLAELKKE